MAETPDPELIIERNVSDSEAVADETPKRIFDSFGMNPRTLRFFLLEKGIDLPLTEVDILGAENRTAPYILLNPAGQLPSLELHDGTIISEVPAICEYLEDLNPEPALIGRTPKERAITRMWWRRVELNICLPMVQGFYYDEALELFQTRFRCLPEAAEGLKERGRDGMLWIDGLISGDWLAGSRFTVADICLYCYIDQLCEVGQPIPEACTNLKAWFSRVDSRPAAKKSIFKDRPMGMRG